VSNRIIATNKDITYSADYKAVERSINRIIDSGAIHLSARQCISASDMMYISLLHQGIKSHLVECQLTVTYPNQDLAQVAYIGFDEDAPREGELDAHVVCVTDTDPPMLIDTSISYLLPTGRLAVIAGLEKGPNRIISTSITDIVCLTYQEKIIQKIPMAHQTSILDRIETDRVVRSDIELLKKLNFVGIFLSFFMLISILTYIVYTFTN
jgi:hypothetical protein